MAESPRKTGTVSAPRTAKKRAYERPIATASRRVLPKNDTEGGLTEAQKKTVAAEESRVKARKTELGIIVDKEGKVLHRVPGTHTSVSFDGVPDKDFKDAVIVHNHPGYHQEKAFGDTFATRVGSPLSPRDVVFAAEKDAAEIRVITSNNRGKGGYVYSIRRPAGGWPDKRTVESYARGVTSAGTREANAEYARVRSTSSWGDYDDVVQQRMSRAELLAQWHQMQAFTRLLGTTITRRRYNG